MVRSLASHVGVWTAGTVTSVMAVFALVEHARGTPLADAFLWHGVHMLIVIPAVYVVLRLVLGRLVVEPIRSITAHLYRTGTGVLESLSPSSTVREICALQSGVGIMVSRIKLGRGAEETTQEDLAALREAAQAIRATAPSLAEDILTRTTRLQDAVSRLQLAPRE